MGGVQGMGSGTTGGASPTCIMQQGTGNGLVGQQQSGRTGVGGTAGGWMDERHPSIKAMMLEYEATLGLGLHIKLHVGIGLTLLTFLCSY
jgi:hypothetical protein